MGQLDGDEVSSFTRCVQIWSLLKSRSMTCSYTFLYRPDYIFVFPFQDSDVPHFPTTWQVQADKALVVERSPVERSFAADRPISYFFKHSRLSFRIAL